ncbi:uncharacterized protein LOC129882120 [Solanum dulcamara]|uniref:uncharacterized protein LOC129882120 n=1 Tax=Solanum dulcamara TaxID=45834 RepID=UPI002486C792|nr:uncharacterized protein LOC129882120 [Solanum dulcamara]
MEGCFTSFDQLPEDIIMEILSILPVESILKLKSVCKYWYILIQSPNFIIKHFFHKNNYEIPFVHLYFFDTNQLSISIDEYPLLQDFYLHKSTSLKPVIGPLNGLFFVHNLDKNEMSMWNPVTEEIKNIIVPSLPFYPCFSGLCCSDSSKMLHHSCEILQKCIVSGGSDMHPSIFLKSPSNIDFSLCCSDYPKRLSYLCPNLKKCVASGGSDTQPSTSCCSVSPEMLLHSCQILQKCASFSFGGFDMHPSTFLKSPNDNDFRLCRRLDSLELLPHSCQILQKCVASRDSDTHPSTFLKSPSNNDFSLSCSDSTKMLPYSCRILQKCASSGGSDTHPSIFSKSLRSYSHHFGFGMDPLSKDYKVVWIRDLFWQEETFTRSASAVVSVYSLSTNSWRHFEDKTFLSSHIIMSYFDSYLDGFYYWKKLDDKRRCEILVFDFRNEDFQVIQTPDVFNSNLGTLGLYDGSVSMLFHYLVQSKTCIEIWVMEKFGFWTKKLVLESTLIVKRPIGYGVNGEIFLETTSSNLAMIDPRTQEIVKCLGPILGNGYSLQVLVYKKSLVSIKKLTTCNLTKGLTFEQLGI